MSNKELAEKIRNNDIWDPVLLEELCDRAGLADEYKQADSETFEQVVFRAAEILNIEIL